MAINTKQQKIQEDQYVFPYHYIIEKNSYSGFFYYSYLDKCIELIYNFENKKILDAGCGDGFL